LAGAGLPSGPGNCPQGFAPGTGGGTLGPGCYRLDLSLHIAAAQGRSLCPHLSSAEFAPPPALPPTWIYSPDPVGGVDRTSLGFQVTVRLERAPKGN
jgi:hypothetical protein